MRGPGTKKGRTKSQGGAYLSTACPMVRPKSGGFPGPQAQLQLVLKSTGDCFLSATQTDKFLNLQFKQFLSATQTDKFLNLQFKQFLSATQTDKFLNLQFKQFSFANTAIKDVRLSNLNPVVKKSYKKYLLSNEHFFSSSTDREI